MSMNAMEFDLDSWSSAEEFLVSAADAIGDRAADRDMPQERSMARAVAMFNALTGLSVSEREGWVFMALLKLSRAQGGRFCVDDYVDGAAYVALAAESVQPTRRFVVGLPEGGAAAGAVGRARGLAGGAGQGQGDLGDGGGVGVGGSGGGADVNVGLTKWAGARP